jgi:hypothetical protein
MTFHEYLAKARQHDAQRAGELDRLRQEARQARTVLRHRTGPVARARCLARLIRFCRRPFARLSLCCRALTGQGVL